MGMKEIQEKLMSTLGKSKRTINRYIKTRRKDADFTWDRKIAALSLLADSDIDPTKYASQEELEELRDLQIYLKPKPPSIPKKKSSDKSKEKVRTYEYRLRTNLGNVPLNLTPSDMKNAEHMTEAYYHLFILENSLRKFIMEVMESKFGDDWWDEVNLRKSTMKKAASRKKRDEGNLWHGKRGRHPIYYIDFEDYKNIIQKYWTLFEPYFSEVFGAQEWILTRIRDITLSRNNIAHTGYLTDDDISRILLNLKDWLRQIASE